MQLDLRAFYRFCFVVWIFGASLHAQEPSSNSKPDQPFNLPTDFEAREVAGDSLVHDAFCMTLDSKGRPVVSGPGYVRTLLDDNQDGIFDRAIDWAKLPKQGAQGLWVEGSDLYWVGDGGVWKSRDANNDLVGDGQPTKVLSVPTGGEHDSHALRRGPDGYWYLIVGNFANGVTSILNSPNSPIAKPRAGTVWRISPDFKTRSVWSHGLRNAYDFDFLPDGQIVTFDSDGERDITLPLYRPTRVMVLAPGSDAGWVGEAWKDDDHRVTMPRVLASLGRSSPTGVAVYRHHQFPAKYTDAVFVLDWTFGRVMALYPESVSVDASNPEEKKLRLGAETFMESVGTIGFAPTDICVDPSGGLLISVGGRGTRGAIYQVRYVGGGSANVPPLFANEPKPTIETVSAKSESTNRNTVEWTPEQLKTLQEIVFAPCPLEAWSQAVWRPKVAELELSRVADTAANVFRDPVTKAELSVSARIGAFQKLLQYDRALAPGLLDKLLKDSDPDIQALAWRTIAWDKVGMQPTDMKRWQDWVESGPSNAPSSPWSALFGATALQARLECTGLRRWPITEAMRKTFEESPFATARELRHAWLWAISRQQRSGTATKKFYSTLDEAAGALLYGTPPTKVDSATMDAVAKSSNARTIGKSIDQQLEAIQLILAALGDMRHFVAPQQNTPNPTIFDGYEAKYTNQLQETSRNGWAAWAISIAKNAMSAGQPEVQAEAIRLLATLRPSDPKVHQYCLEQIHAKSHPTSDIHVLIAVASCTGARTSEDTAATAKALIELQDKVRSRGLNTDNHWQPRLTQLFDRLIQVDPALPNQMVNSPNFGSADHLLFAEKFPAAIKTEAQRQIKARLPQLAAKQWSPTLLKFANVTANDKEILASLRSAASEPTLRSTAIDLLSKNPTEEDYDVFLEALGGTDRTAWKSAWLGLNRLPILRATDELVPLTIQCIRIEGITSDPPAVTLMARMRQCCEKLSWPAPPKSSDTQSWCEYLKAHLDEASFARIESVREPAGAWISKVDQMTKLTGDTARGKLLFAQAKCAQCHGGGSGLGPDLQGISKRFSRSDLFRAIFEPNRDISDRYRAMKVLTSDSNIIVGMKVYDSADGVTLQTADGTLVRINQDDIEQKGFATESLMPVGLLDGMTPQQLADLYLYMQSL